MTAVRRKSTAKDDQQDNRESIKMLNMLPIGFLWNITSSQGENITLHFKPNPAYHAPDIESRVFAVTEGDMIVTKEEHRIVTIKGRMMRGVKFAGGLFGGLDPGGTFDVERRQTGQANGRSPKPTSTFMDTCCSSKPSPNRKMTRKQSSNNFLKNYFFSASRKGTFAGALEAAPKVWRAHRLALQLEVIEQLRLVLTQMLNHLVNHPSE